MSNKKLLLLGGGGHCKSVLDVLKETKYYSEISIIDSEDRVGSRVLNCEIIGTDDDLELYFENGYGDAFVTLGSMGNYSRREELHKKLKDIGFFIPNVISKNAIVSDYVDMGEGNFIGKGAIVNAGSRIVDQVIINTAAIIEHDCCIDSFVHIAPNSTLSGNVKIKKGTHIGTGAVVIQNRTIGSDTIIGAGSVVVSNISGSSIAYGNPCKEMKNK